MESSPERDNNIRERIVADELPDRRQSVRGYENDRRFYAVEAIPNERQYRCAACAGEISVMSSHVYVEKPALRGRANHSHLHRNPCWGELVSRSVDLEIIPKRQTTPKRMARRRRKH